MNLTGMHSLELAVIFCAFPKSVAYGHLCPSLSSLLLEIDFRACRPELVCRFICKSGNYCGTSGSPQICVYLLSKIVRSFTRQDIKMTKTESQLLNAGEHGVLNVSGGLANGIHALALRLEPIPDNLNSLPCMLAAL
jgi:hypothetical protein